jgi:DNA-binding MarR family transcriptional regulator
MTIPEGRAGQWTFLTNHALVLLCIARNPDTRLRDIAAAVSITERAVQAIIADLEAAGYLTRTRVGRRNRYQLHSTQPLRHPLEREHEVEDLFAVLAPTAEAASEGGP